MCDKSEKIYKWVCDIIKTIGLPIIVDGCNDNHVQYYAVRNKKNTAFVAYCVNEYSSNRYKEIILVRQPLLTKVHKGKIYRTGPRWIAKTMFSEYNGDIELEIRRKLINVYKFLLPIIK